jgi:two-component system chemotaxis response regulator CheB
MTLTMGRAPVLTGAGEVAPIRVVVVDDSAFLRFMISKHLNEAAGMQVVATAHDGEEALKLVAQHQPDVVTLDVEMPRMDGLTTLRAIMSQAPRPVVMISSLTSEGARETVQALTLGAVDFVTKPATRANVGSVMEEVVAKVRAAARARVRIVRAPTTPIAPLGGERAGLRLAAGPTKDVRPLRTSDRIVVIGASTGGPRALQTVMSGVSASWPAAMVIVQHMPIGFTRSLAERLDGLSGFQVREARPGDELQVGLCLIAPGGFHLQLDETGKVKLNQNPPVHGVRPSVDVTLMSVAQRYQQRVVTAILTGMGSDGTQGAALVNSLGGRVIAEDESTCVVWGMPRSVAESGAAHEIVPLPDVARALERAARA